MSAEGENDGSGDRLRVHARLKTVSCVSSCQSDIRKRQRERRTKRDERVVGDNSSDSQSSGTENVGLHDEILDGGGAAEDDESVDVENRRSDSSRFKLETSSSVFE